MRPESRFSSPNGWCGSPQLWHADDDQATEWEVSELVAAFVRALQPEHVIETGTYTGQTSEAIGRALQKNGHGILTTFEIDGRRATRAATRCRGLPVHVVRGRALDEIDAGALRGLPWAGLVWIDSDPAVRAKELLAVAPYLGPGAVIGIHDTRPGRPAAVSLDRLVASGKLDALTLRTPRGVTFAQIRR